MSAPEPAATDDDIVLSAKTRDFILKALGETSVALSRTHGLRATSHIMMEEGIQLTQDNSFRINNGNHLLLMKLIRRLLSAAPADEAQRPGTPDD